MNKLKEGANFVGSNVKAVGSTATTATKTLGSTTGKNLKSIGTNIKDFSERQSEKFHKHSYSIDEELISRYQHDFKQVSKGLKFVKHQVKKLTNSYYPSLFQINENIAIHFLKLMGENSLKFPGIEQYYHDWIDENYKHDDFQIHPLEKDYTINSINVQLFNYYKSLNNLKLKTLEEWKFQLDSLIDQINQGLKYIKATQSLIKLWFKKKLKSDKLIRKIDSLNNKSVLSDKNQQDMTNYQIKLQDYQQNFQKIDLKIKSVLPHFTNFLNEFIDTIAKLLFLKQNETFESIKNHFHYFLNFYGNLSNINYETIIKDWENCFTPVKIQMESFISILISKDHDNMQPLNDDEFSPSKMSTLFDKLTNKITTKTYQFEGKNQVNGIFDGILDSDPLDSFIKYFDYGINRSETYHLKKLIHESDLVVTPTMINKDVPPLPPRSNIVENRQALPMPLPKSPLLSNKSSNTLLNPKSPLSSTIDQFDSYIDETESENEDNSSITSSSSSNLLAESDQDTSSLSTQDILRDSNEEYIERELIKVYNSSKNDIKVAPIIKSKFSDFTYQKSLTEPMTTTRKLDEYNQLFGKLIDQAKSSPIRKVTAKLDFRGIQPGDLSFQANDEIEILFDFQSVGSLYSNNDKNWMIGLINFNEISRVGFVPSNYLNL